MEDEDGIHGGHNDQTALVLVDSIMGEKDLAVIKQNPTEKDNHGRRRLERLYRRIELSLTKPSYTLTLGPKNVRQKNRGRLRCLLCKLVKGHNWKEASGVLSTLLKGTSRERSVLNNRIKYSLAMELLGCMESDNTSSNKMNNIFHLWRNKVGLINKDSYVAVEFILHSLTQGNLDDAHQAAVGLMSDNHGERDPLSNLVLGLTFFQLWYSKLPEDIKLSSFDVSYMPEESEASSVEFHEPARNPKQDDAISIMDIESQLDSNSEASIRNDELLGMDFNDCLAQEQLQAHNMPQNIGEIDKEEQESFPLNEATNYPSVLCANGLHPSLLPLKLPNSDEDIEEFVSYYDGFFNDHYDRALQFLELAISATPPLMEALLPLIQLLLLRDQLEYALTVLRELCPIADVTLPFRLRAYLVEFFHCGTYAELVTCYEAIAKMDPTCGHSLKRLVMLTRIGEYDPYQLLDTIGLHLDATNANSDIWREFASCLLKISQNEEDRMSTCSDGEGTGNGEGNNVHLSRIPLRFTAGITGKTWKLRCRWWLKRHFSKDIVASEIKAGKIELMIGKAACAAHFYGPQFEYVVKVRIALRDEGDESMEMFLQTHIANAMGLCSHMCKKHT